MPSTRPAHILEHSRCIPFFVFAVKAFDADKLHTKIVSFYIENKVPIEQQIDGICVNGVGMVKNVKHPELNQYNADPPIGKSTGWYLEEWGDISCLGLLLSLELSFSSVAGISDSIMRRLLTKIGESEVTRLGDGVS